MRAVNQTGSGRTRPISLFHIVLLVVYIAIVALLIILPDHVDPLSKLLEPVDTMTRFYIALTLGIAIAIIIMVGIAAGMARTEESPSRAEVTAQIQRKAPSQMPVAVAPVVRTADGTTPRIEQKQGPPTVVVYPDLVEGGIFGDTFIRISSARTLKLRTLVVEPEHLS
jgi:hypothetical protein